jgi:uncharacterized coiled-coil protein SlyX
VPAADDALTERVLDLEIRSAYQERTIEALDAVIRDFTRRVELLESALTELRRGSSPQPLEPPSEDDFSPF